MRPLCGVPTAGSSHLGPSVPEATLGRLGLCRFDSFGKGIRRGERLGIMSHRECIRLAVDEGQCHVFYLPKCLKEPFLHPFPVSDAFAAARV